ncbi:hypothetical protein G6F40_016898 [Rhizopus arrhizus]|nr:hypothetical protein G6F40_016898 [Rhizopus arrhizus]
MRVARAGMHEYELEAELLYEFRRHGAQAVAYNSIVAAGANACVLHYPAGEAVLRDGDLVLHGSPVSAAHVLRKLLWDEVDSVVMTSATLTGGGDFQPS